MPLLSPRRSSSSSSTSSTPSSTTFGNHPQHDGGGPAKATEILVYKVYYDGVVALDLGGSSAESVILMAIVTALHAIQFRYVERKVHY